MHDDSESRERATHILKALKQKEKIHKTSDHLEQTLLKVKDLK
jgi:hypothetical protein